MEYFTHHPNKPKFIIRAKHLDRVVFQQGSKTKIELANLPNYSSIQIEKLKIKKTEYQNLTLDLTWGEVTLVNDFKEEAVITVIQAKLLNKQQSVFDKDFYLLTNQDIQDQEQAYQIYLNYFIRWKIEVVFKFLKDTLGLESFRVFEKY